jgi:hypothetical protein
MSDHANPWILNESRKGPQPNTANRVRYDAENDGATAKESPELHENACRHALRYWTRPETTETTVSAAFTLPQPIAAPEAHPPQLYLPFLEQVIATDHSELASY